MDSNRKITKKFTNKFDIKDNLLNGPLPVERSLRSLLRSLVVKLLIDNIFIERLGLRQPFTMIIENTTQITCYQSLPPPFDCRSFNSS